MKNLLEKLLGNMSRSQLNVLWAGTFIGSLATPNPYSTILFVVCFIVCIYTWIK